MKDTALTLDDLVPEEATLVLNGKPYILNKITLFEQLHIRRTYGEEMLGQIFTDLRIGEISEIAYYLVRDKTDFPTLESFQKSIVTAKDRVQMVSAMFKTVGVSQPVIEKLNAENAPPQKKKI